MNWNRVLLSCVIASMALWACSVNADDATVTLDLNYSGGAGSAGTWQLFGRIDDTAGPADGQFGLSAVRALLDNIDFGTLGDAITFAPGNGAIDPIAENTPNERPAVLELPVTGTIDLVYGQDLGESETFPGSGVFRSVVTNVGNSGDTLLASGTFSAGSTPAFGVDNTGPSTLFTQALFLTNGSSPFTAAIDADNTFAIVTLAADYNGNGVVDAADYTKWRDTLGSTSDLDADGNGSGTVDTGDYTVWKNNFGVALGAGIGVGTSVPEPSALVLALAMGSLILCRRQRN